MDPTPGAEETYENVIAEGADEDSGLAEMRLSVALKRLVDEPSALNAFLIPLLDPPLDVDEEGAETKSAERADRDVYDRSFPFARAYGIPLPKAESEATADPSRYPALNAYFAEINHWRRIDLDWLMAAKQVAEWVDDFVNNTSLALAFELPAMAGGERKVLLFVADAQVGNWLSWDKIGKWKPRNGAQPSQKTANMEKLLQRAAFYKVGHHGSHNSTLKAKGVERMRTSGKLTAFVPVSTRVAKAAGWGKMPLPNIMNALDELTGGRVVLSHGAVWPHTDEEEIAKARKEIGVEASTTSLWSECVEEECDENTVRIDVPLWVQVAIDY
jgi:hypothetical protein